MYKKKRVVLIWLLLFGVLLSGCAGKSSLKDDSPQNEQVSAEEKKSDSDIEETVNLTEQAENTVLTDSFDLSDIPEYSGSPYIPVNGNVPDFTREDLTTDSFETYSELDELGRCGAAYASVGTDLMPDKKRGSISKVKPSGWHSIEYDNVEGDSLYNRCHLIGYQLTAENANEKNLITGTRYLNTEGMLPFENMVADYVKETKNHVLYRVTPVFAGDDLIAGGVRMEAMSVEDEGEGILFHVYCYNVQPGIAIDYATGGSWADGRTASGDTRKDEINNHETKQQKEKKATYILNTNTNKFHKPSCSSIKKMTKANKKEYTGSREDLENTGYDPCKRCKP